MQEMISGQPQHEWCVVPSESGEPGQEGNAGAVQAEGSEPRQEARGTVQAEGSEPRQEEQAEKSEPRQVEGWPPQLYELIQRLHSHLLRLLDCCNPEELRPGEREMAISRHVMLLLKLQQTWEVVGKEIEKEEQRRGLRPAYYVVDGCNQPPRPVYENVYTPAPTTHVPGHSYSYPAVSSEMPDRLDYPDPNAPDDSDGPYDPDDPDMSPPFASPY